MGQRGQYDTARYDHILSLPVIGEIVFLQNAQSIREIFQGISCPPDTVHHVLVDKGMHTGYKPSFLVKREYREDRIESQVWVERDNWES